MKKNEYKEMKGLLLNDELVTFLAVEREKVKQLSSYFICDSCFFCESALKNYYIISSDDKYVDSDFFNVVLDNHNKNCNFSSFINLGQLDVFLNRMVKHYEEKKAKNYEKLDKNIRIIK